MNDYKYWYIASLTCISIQISLRAYSTYFGIKDEKNIIKTTKKLFYSSWYP